MSVRPVALITGGQKGIGLAIARGLVDAGWSVALAAEQAAETPDVRRALDDLGPAARYLLHDLRQTGGCAALLDDVEDAQGPLSCFVSNAGVPAPRRGDLLEVTPEAFDLTHGVNLRGAFFLAQEAARRLLRAPDRPFRSMIFVTSVSATMASPERGEYCMSKAGAGMMAQLFALRLAADGIGVYDLRPGIVATDMTASVRDRYDRLIDDGLVPARRWGRPDDVAQVVLPLASGQAAFATGAIIPVDGGLSIPRL